MAASARSDHVETFFDEEDGREARRGREATPSKGHFGSSPTLGAERVKIQVETEAKRRATNISQTWATLREVLRRHEDKIQRRWLKKSTPKRLAVLLKAWPNMPTTHRPDFDAFRNETQARREAGTRYRQEYLWPCINQEDLSTPRALLLLLNARGRSLPSEFAGADGDGTRFGLQTRAVVPAYLDNHFMVLNGVRESNQNDYGQLVALQGPGLAGEDCDLGPLYRQFHPGMGLLVLEVQERLLTFLLDICRNILRDIPQDSWIPGLVKRSPFSQNRK